MPEERTQNDPGAAWRNQPEERLPIAWEPFVKRRAGELWSRTRSEILGSIGAAVFLVGIVTWRFQIGRDLVAQVAVASGLVWIAISLYWFRRQIWKAAAPDFATTGVEHYRRELELRRDHLRNVWLWHGPLVIACAALLTVAMRNAYGERLPAVAPLLAILAASIGMDIRRRRRQAKELQREIDELESNQKSVI